MALDDTLDRLRAVQGGEEPAVPDAATPGPAPIGTTPPSDAEIPSDTLGRIMAVQAAPATPPPADEGGFWSWLSPSRAGAPTPPPQAASGGMGATPMDWGAQDQFASPATTGAPQAGYGPAQAMLHGGTATLSDPALGFGRDIARGLGGGDYNFGQGAQEVKTERDQYATDHPYANTAANLVGSVLTAPLLPGGRLFKAAGELASPVARWAATLGTGAGLGAGFGAAGGAIDEAPAGWEKAGEGAVQGAKWGAALGAGIPAAVGAGTGAYRFGRDWLGPLTARGDEGAVGRRIVNAATDPTELTRDFVGPRDPNEGRIVPGSQPTTAQTFSDPGLSSLERQAMTDALAKPEATRTPAEADLVARAQQQATSRTDFFRTGIDPAADPAAFKTELQSQVNAMDAQHAANEAAAQQQLERAQQGLGQPRTPEGRGVDARAAVVEARRVSDENEGKLWDAIDPDKRLRIDARDAKDATNQIIRETSPDDPIVRGSEEWKVYQRAQMAGSAMPFGNFTALRGRLLRAIRTEREANGQTPSVFRMTQLQKSMDDTIANAAAGNFDAGAAVRYREAADFTRQQHEQFGNHYIDPLLATHGRPGDFKVPASNVGDKIIINNESAQAYLTAGGDHATLKGALVDDLNSSLRGGELTPQKLQQFRANREGAIRAVPGLDAELGNVAGAQALVRQLGEVRSTAMAQATSGAVGRVLGGDVQPQIASLLKANPLSDTGRNATSQMMRLRQAATGNPDAEAGLQRAVMNHIDTEFIDPATGNFRTSQFLKFMREKGGAVEAGVGVENMQILRTIERDLQRQGVGAPLPAGATRAGRVGGVSAAWQAAMQGLQKPIVGGTLGPAAVMGAFGLAGGAPAVVTGVGIAGTVIAHVLRANGITRRADLLAEAMGNPALARALAIKATPANVPLIEKGINAAMLASRAAPALSYDYGEADKRQRDQRMRQIYGLPPRGSPHSGL